MPKADIGWKGRTAEGIPREVYACRVGGEWQFFERPARFERWRRLREPTLEDWRYLLDAVERRIRRRLIRPEESGRIRRLILERFPSAEV